MKKNTRVVLAASAAALILACASSANAQYVVQIPVDSILNGRAVTTLTGGTIVTFGNKQGIYSGGQTGYATAAVQMMLAPTSKGVGLPDDGLFPRRGTCRPFSCTFRTPRPPRALRRANCQPRPRRVRRHSSFLSRRPPIPRSTSSWRRGTVRQVSPSRSPMPGVYQAPRRPSRICPTAGRACRWAVLPISMSSRTPASGTPRTRTWSRRTTPSREWRSLRALRPPS